MRLSQRWIILTAAALFIPHAWGPPASTTAEPADSVEEAPRLRLRPPKPPEHRRRNLTTPAELAADLNDTVAYLHAGQAYFRAYQKGSHTVEENALFLRFLEDYERELAVARKEVDALRAWIREKGSLDSVSAP